jgi:hypothetical protein
MSSYPIVLYDEDFAFRSSLRYTLQYFFFFVAILSFPLIPFIRLIQNSISSIFLKQEDQPILSPDFSKEIISDPPVIYYHGNMTEGASFYTYPRTELLQNHWDTHLVPFMFCSHHKRGGKKDGPKGQKHYVCLGHTFLADFISAEMEWKREKYTCSSLGPLRHGAPRKGIWTNLMLEEWKERDKQSRK